MKRVLHFKSLIICMIMALPFCIYATTENKWKNEKSKTIKKEFSVSPNATLKIDNSYGNLNIVTGTGNKIVFEVTIIASGSNDDKIMDKLNDVDVSFSASKELVSARTQFNKGNSNSWWGGKNKINIKVNYLVKIPITNHVDLKNDYGNINLEKLEGNAKIDCDYGKITTMELMGNNDLKFDYSKGCFFEYVKNGKINADYSEFTISKANSINLNADYTNANFENLDELIYNGDYGKIEVEKAQRIVGNGDYLTVLIGDLSKEATLKSDYGAIKIDRITENAKSITISSDYTGIKLGYGSNTSFQLHANLSYCNLKDEGDLVITKETKDSGDKSYKGYYGNSNSTNQITIKSDYGNVTLFKN